MTRMLFVTTMASVVSIAAATSLLAAPAASRADACESNWIVVASGNCPENVMEYCAQEVKNCTFNSEYTYCSEGTEDGFTVYCQV
jgi:hypothetical protein